ncbi:MAG: hypothetical protein R2726_18215 [Acidimicrobiales bacterium]
MPSAYGVSVSIFQSLVTNIGYTAAMVAVAIPPAGPDAPGGDADTTTVAVPISASRTRTASGDRSPRVAIVATSTVPPGGRQALGELDPSVMKRIGSSKPCPSATIRPCR